MSDPIKSALIQAAATLAAEKLRLEAPIIHNQISAASGRKIPGDEAHASKEWGTHLTEEKIADRFAKMLVEIEKKWQQHDRKS